MLLLLMASYKHLYRVLVEEDSQLYGQTITSWLMMQIRQVVCSEFAVLFKDSLIYQFGQLCGVLYAS